MSLGGKARPLLRFLDEWDHSSTLDMSLEKQLSSTGSFGLEYLREIDALRRSTVMKQSSISEFPDSEHLERFEQYLGHVRRIIKRADQAMEFKCSWTSPLSGKPHHSYKLTGLQLEQAMAAFTMGSAMRSAAYLLTAAAGGVDGLAHGEVLPAAALSAAADNATSTAAGAFADASTLLRKAAGLYTWLSEDSLKQGLLTESLPADRPVELLPALSACMRLICLAEAQSITAHRAGQRGSKASITSQLHLAASDLFEQAARVLKEHAGELKSLSDRLRRFLAISATMQKSKSRLWWGEELRTEGRQAGQAEGCLVEAATALKECMAVAEGDVVWKHTLTLELANVEEFRLRCEKDRTGVYFQSVARPPQTLPASGKVLVTAIEYVPTEAASQNLDIALE